MTPKKCFPLLAALLATALLQCARARAYAATLQTQRPEQQRAQLSTPQPDARPGTVNSSEGANANPSNSSEGVHGGSVEELRGELARAPASPTSNFNLGAALFSAGRFE